MMNELTIFALIALVVALVVGYRILRGEKAGSVGPPPAPRRTREKCHIRTFSYSDGAMQEFHTCQGAVLGQLTDQYASGLRPPARLVAVKDKVHYINRRG